MNAFIHSHRKSMHMNDFRDRVNWNRLGEHEYECTEIELFGPIDSCSIHSL